MLQMAQSPIKMLKIIGFYKANWKKTAIFAYIYHLQTVDES